MGLLPKVGNCSKTVKPATSSTKDVLTGSDNMINAIIPDIEHKEIPPTPIPESNTEQQDTDNKKSSDNLSDIGSSNNEPVITKRESETGGAVSGSDRTAEQIPHKDDAIVIVSDTELRH